jgi:hypothetical protein
MMFWEQTVSVKRVAGEVGKVTFDAPLSTGCLWGERIVKTLQEKGCGGAEHDKKLHEQEEESDCL